jgi:hypothetical protein
MEAKETRLGKLILNPNPPPPPGVTVTGPVLSQPYFPIPLPDPFSAERYNTRPTFTIDIGGTRTYFLLHEDYPFESAFEISYNGQHIWIIYGSGGK